MTDEIIQHYTQAHDEESRLADRIGPFEYERTQSVIARYLDRGQQIVVDAGGGTGAYALWLAEQGHEVHFIDLVPRHVDMVREKARKRSLTTFSLKGELGWRKIAMSAYDEGSISVRGGEEGDACTHRSDPTEY